MRGLIWVLAMALVPAWTWALGDEVFDLAVDVVAPAEVPAATPADRVEPLRLSGTTEALAAVVRGQGTAAAATVVTTLNLDARPFPGLVAHTSLLVAFPSTTAVTLDQVYLDVHGPWAALRVGKQTTTWEAARIFTVVDLAEESATGYSARGTLSWGGGAAVFQASAPVPTHWEYVNTTGSGTTVTSLPMLSDLTAAGRLEWVGSGYEVSVSARQGKASGFNPAVRLTFGGLDVFDEVLVEHRFGQVGYRWSNVGGFFWSMQQLEAYGEWAVDQKYSTPSAQTQGSLVVRLVHLGTNDGQVGVQWTHSLTDGTGRVLPGYGFQVVDGVRVTLGVPVDYSTTGGDGLYFLNGATERVALGAKLDVTASY